MLYGIGLGLTFDEFGLWVHLGGSYWQRASFDAVVVVAGLLALASVAPTLRQFRPHHRITIAALAITVTIVAALLVDSFKDADRVLLRVPESESHATGSSEGRHGTRRVAWRNGADRSRRTPGSLS